MLLADKILDILNCLMLKFFIGNMQRNILQSCVQNEQNNPVIEDGTFFEFCVFDSIFKSTIDANLKKNNS